MISAGSANCSVDFSTEQLLLVSALVSFGDLPPGSRMGCFCLLSLFRSMLSID